MVDNWIKSAVVKKKPIVSRAEREKNTTEITKRLDTLVSSGKYSDVSAILRKMETEKYKYASDWVVELKRIINQIVGQERHIAEYYQKTNTVGQLDGIDKLTKSRTEAQKGGEFDINW